MGNLIKQETSLIINEEEISVGDLLVGSDRVYEVTGFEEDEYGPKIIHNNYPYNESGISSMRESDLKQYYKVVKGITMKETRDIADKILSGDLNPKDLAPKKEHHEEGLMKADKTFYEIALSKSKEAHGKMNAIKKMVESKADAIKSKMRGLMAVHEKTIKRLQSIIFTIELYAGIEEDIKHIQSGIPAEESEAIYLNQLMRFMDEEVGDPSNGGISFDSIDRFDDWLLEKNEHLKCFNYELLLPQQKCVRTMRVRYKPQERWSYDSWGNRWEIQKELGTYIMIRNGENIYTINSKMKFNERLFPEAEELTEIMEIEDSEKRYDKLEDYRNGMVLMQGLIDRTTVFGEVAGRINLLKNESVERGEVVFQYEIGDDKLVTDGSKTFLDFLNTNEIKGGDRILFIADRGLSTEKRLYKQYYSNEFSVPPGPDTGIYKIEEDRDYRGKENPVLYFKYLPEDTVYTWHGSHARKNKLSYEIRPSDSCIVNIDAVSHRDIGWLNNMLYDRRDRKQYMRIVGTLRNLQKYKNAELEEERPFLLMMIAQNEGVSEIEMLDAIHWWKTKNKHKRALTVDDQKAIRMINKYLKKP